MPGGEPQEEVVDVRVGTPVLDVAHGHGLVRGFPWGESKVIGTERQVMKP